MILYVEQPFPYDLEAHPHRRAQRRARASRCSWTKAPTTGGTSALGRSLGWTGVALKTCKTQTGALLSLCWAKAHGMHLMVQDLTNPMLAQIPHVLLAAHADTIMGVETNAHAVLSRGLGAPRRAVHPGLYQRRGGALDLTTIGGRDLVTGSTRSCGRCRRRRHSVWRPHVEAFLTRRLFYA